MPGWVIWAIIAVLLALGELATPGLFFLGPVALAAIPVVTNRFYTPRDDVPPWFRGLMLILIFTIFNWTYTARLVRGQDVRVKILAEGELTKNLTIHANGFSAKAIEKIEAAKGKAVVVADPAPAAAVPAA